MPDRIDDWLVEHYPPTTLAERFEIREAVASGRLVRDPALRDAACALATEMLNGRFRDRNRVLLVSVAAAVISGVAFVLVHAGGGGSALSDAAVAVIWLMVAVRHVAASKPRRDRTEPALRLNSSEPR